MPAKVRSRERRKTGSMYVSRKDKVGRSEASVVSVCVDMAGAIMGCAVGVEYVVNVVLKLRTGAGHTGSCQCLATDGAGSSRGSR